jgi:hypothetical protein
MSCLPGLFPIARSDRSPKPLQQGLRLDQVDRVEALGEPTVDGGQQLAGSLRRP